MKIKIKLPLIHQKSYNEWAERAVLITLRGTREFPVLWVAKASLLSRQEAVVRNPYRETDEWIFWISRWTDPDHMSPLSHMNQHHVDNFYYQSFELFV